MILPKRTLEQIESYSIRVAKDIYQISTVNDVITLRFKGWFKKDQDIYIVRTTVSIEDDTFFHQSSEEALQLLDQLEKYMASTFSNERLAPKKTKATVLSIVPKEKI